MEGESQSKSGMSALSQRSHFPAEVKGESQRKSGMGALGPKEALSGCLFTICEHWVVFHSDVSSDSQINCVLQALEAVFLKS